MQHLGQLISALFLLFTLISCQGQENHKSQDSFIEWDEATLVCIADEGAYPRLRRLKDNSLFVVYENRKGDVVVKRSTDKGANWSDPVTAYERFEHTGEAGATSKVNIANPEIVQLDNGDILLACNLRPQKEGIYPFSIALKRSEDEGVTWSDAQILYEAGLYFRDGCWEPSFLALPDGTLHIYFANEFPYQSSDEQEISMLVSTDSGSTWSEEPTAVSFRKGHRDGMPVAVHNGRDIFVTIEDNLSGQFKPYMIQGSVDNPWENPVCENSSHRYSALQEPLPDAVYAGAPYLIRTDRNLFVLSYQTTENRTSNWELSTMEVVISDKSSNFKNPTRPFNVPLSSEAKWNSLADLGNDTIAALSSTNFNSEKIGVWMIKGKIFNN
jgi:BNR/Asp-box repeat.